MTDEELKELVASLAIAQKKTDEELKKFVDSLAVSKKKTDEQLKATDEKMRETDEMIRKLGEQIGGLGEKFGGFTEGMAFPSMEKILRERFKMDVIAPNIKSRKNGRLMEIDVLAYSNSDVKEVYVVEVKSRLRKDGLEQMENTLTRFFEFFPSHKGKKLYGILAVVDAPENLAAEVLNKGIYLAKIRDNVFEIQEAEHFVPRAYK